MENKESIESTLGCQIQDSVRGLLVSEVAVVDLPRLRGKQSYKMVYVYFDETYQAVKYEFGSKAYFTEGEVGEEGEPFVVLTVKEFDEISI